MKYYSNKQLLSKNNYTSVITENNSRRYKVGKMTIFLSHSHQDKDIIIPAIGYFLSLGIHIYVDWKDSTMPSTTSAETASRIRSKINECDKFVVLLSDNAVASKWVPWELGFADGIGKDKTGNLAIFPIIKNSSSPFNGIEYFGLYPKIGFDEINGLLSPRIEGFQTRDLGKMRLSQNGWLNKTIF